MQTLEDFYRFMDELATVRRTVTAHFVQHTETPVHTESLAKALQAIDELPTNGEGTQLEAAGREITVTLDYERTELLKDIAFLEQTGRPGEAERGSDAFLSDFNNDFENRVGNAVDFLSKRHFETFVSDRDGTVNNYCGRYRSSHQSIYNAYYLSRFATSAVSHPVLLTSAPLQNHGLIDLSAMPERTIHYAGSKGREYRSKNGVAGRMAIPHEQQEALAELNRRIGDLLAQDEYRVFGLIGSAVQYKFGQTTVSRQDIHGSIPRERSDAFLETVTTVVRDLDPDGTVFQIEDTGLDIEIMLTVEGSKDFDKGDGIRFLDDELAIGLSAGSTLICGDTSSDVPMVEAAVDLAGHENVATLFVTEDADLRDRVRETGADCAFVTAPDILVAALGRIGLD